MRLEETLERLAREHESMFQAQLAREDLGRVRRLRELAASAPDADTFRRAGMRLGWTQGDARTGELVEPLAAFLDLFYMREAGGAEPVSDAALEEAWLELHRVRMERLIGCLSTPLAKPVD